MKKVFVSGYGCSLNQADTDMIRSLLTRNHHALTNNPREADIGIINTCAVKEVTEHKMHTAMKELRQSLPTHARLIVFGCLSAVNPEKITQMESSAEVVQPRLSALAQLLGFEELDFSPALNDVRSNPFVTILPIQRGCLSNCSFCATKIARGNLVSYSLDSLVARVKKDVSNGVKEFWLTGQDVGCYGFDIGSDLSVLLTELISIEGDFRLRVGMMSPQHVIKIREKLLPVFSSPKIYRFFHLPLQSGNNRVLKMMRRTYTVEQFRTLVNDIRAAYPDAMISTDIIVGFPTETEAEFLETISLAHELKFGGVNLSRYGIRKGTDAATMEGQVPGIEKRERSTVFARVYKPHMLSFHDALLFKEYDVFFSTGGKHPHTSLGRLPNYVPIVVTGDVVGKWARVQVTKSHTNYVEGAVVREIIPSNAPPKMDGVALSSPASF